MEYEADASAATWQAPGELPPIKFGASVWRLHVALVAWDDPTLFSFEETDRAWLVDESVELAAIVTGEYIYGHQGFSFTAP